MPEVPRRGCGLVPHRLFLQVSPLTPLAFHRRAQAARDGAGHPLALWPSGQAPGHVASTRAPRGAGPPCCRDAFVPRFVRAGCRGTAPQALLPPGRRLTPCLSRGQTSDRPGISSAHEERVDAVANPPGSAKGRWCWCMGSGCAAAPRSHRSCSSPGRPGGGVGVAHRPRPPAHTPAAAARDVLRVPTRAPIAPSPRCPSPRPAAQLPRTQRSLALAGPPCLRGVSRAPGGDALPGEDRAHWGDGLQGGGLARSAPQPWPA